METKFKGKRSAEKNLRTKQRNAQHKRDNIEKMGKLVHRDPMSQLAVLDSRLGKGVGAKRERAKLAAKISKAIITP